MLRTIAELLEAINEKELQILQTFGDIGHQGMIGDMYEGLTRSLLDKALFQNIDLRVVTGKVRMEVNVYSRQLDVMVVVGEGERLPHTEHLIYPASHVIAVIEVKKTLYQSALEESYRNLISLSHESYYARIPKDAFDLAYRRILNSYPPEDGDLTQLPWAKRMLAYELIAEVAMPVRIVFGYSGYRTEETLRTGFLDYLERVHEAGNAEGYGPANFPSLIVCGNSSLIKLNAMPYSMQHHAADAWLVYASYGRTPLVLLLEVIWTRLTSLGLVHPNVFGEDLTLEALNPLLYAVPARDDVRSGWMYTAVELSAIELAAAAPESSWQPEFLTVEEGTLLSHLCLVGQLDTRTDAFWNDFVKSIGDADGGFVSRLRMAGIAALDESGTLRLLTEKCTIAVHPIHGFVAGENSTGRLERWLIREPTAARPKTEGDAGSL